MDDLVTWLLEQVAEDERENNAPGRYYDDPGYWTAERVAAECESKRRLIDMYQAILETGGFVGTLYANAAAPALQLLALPYADRPGYREEWLLAAIVMDPRDPAEVWPDLTLSVQRAVVDALMVVRVLSGNSSLT
jgi:hypothetical protein